MNHFLLGMTSVGRASEFTDLGVYSPQVNEVK